MVRNAECIMHGSGTINFKWQYKSLLLRYEMWNILSIVEIEEERSKKKIETLTSIVMIIELNHNRNQKF